MTENANVEDLTVRYEEEGVVVIDELDKRILSKGAWATVIFLFREWDRKAGDYKAGRKATIRRYRKVSGSFRQQSKFNISSANQGMAIAAILQEWFKDQAGAGAPGAAPSYDGEGEGD